MSLADLAHLSPKEQRELAWFGAAQGQSDPNQIAGKPQVWKVGGRYFVAYYIPGSSVPMVWEATEQELRDKYGGVDSPMPAIDREMSEEQFANIAPWHAGRISEIRLTADDPWSQFYSEYRKNAALRPWLNDPDMLATIATAYLEGREPTADELAQTDWWNNHTEGERRWLEESVTLGSNEVARRGDTAYRETAELLRQAGANNLPESVVRWIAERRLTGQWSDAYFAEQIRKIADPFAAGNLDPYVAALLQDAEADQHDRTRAEEDTVREMATRWLGPTMGSMSQDEIERWAGRIRNDPDAQFEFEQHLKMQRLALFPNYTNENLSYEDIVSPFRRLAENTWGQAITDETMLVDLANTGDYMEAQKRLRQAGLDMGIQKVVTDALGELSGTAMGNRIARSTI